MTLRLIRFFVLFDAIIGAKISKCPDTDLNFIKIHGFQPSLKGTATTTLNHKQIYNSSTIECIVVCREMNEDCASVTFSYANALCTILASSTNLQPSDDSNTVWFVKKCHLLSPGSDETCDKLWISEVYAGATLIGEAIKLVDESCTRDECIAYCLGESEFRCKSANFRHHREPGNKGACTLSDENRHSVPNAFRVSTYEDEYIENQCVPQLISNGTYCAYDEYQNVTLTPRTDVFVEGLTRDECQYLCDTELNFNCRSFSLVVPMVTARGKSGLFNCFLHSEDSRIYGPRSLIRSPMPGSSYHEKTQCLNLSVTCSETRMVVQYTPKSSFNGRLYMAGFYSQPDCYSSNSYAANQESVTLKLSLLSPERCGLIRATSGDNRTLISGNMVIQYNPLVQTQGDRLIRIGCVFGTNSSLVVIGTGVGVMPTGSSRGSVLYNTTTPSPPMVEMRIIDPTGAEIGSVEIGQELQLIIEMEPVPPNGTNLDMWAGHLVAMTENGTDSILLLDDRGCPTNLAIFPKLERVTTNTSSRQLVGTFQAFKFPSSPIVRFSVVVEFCEGKCPAVECEALDADGKERAKRNSKLETITGTSVVKINDAKHQNSLPLEVVMLVRDPKASADRLILGGHKILVAGYDYVNNEVCLDYSLMIGLLVTWCLIQIILLVVGVLLVRRYKKYYEYQNTRQSLEELHRNFVYGQCGSGLVDGNEQSRHVHWADIQ